MSQFLDEKQRPRALMALKQKKDLEALFHSRTNHLMNLDNLLFRMQNAESERQVCLALHKEGALNAYHL